MRRIGKGVNGAVYELPNGTIRKFTIGADNFEKKVLSALQGSHLVPRLLGFQQERLKPMTARRVLGTAVFPNRMGQDPMISAMNMSRVGQMTLFEYLKRFPQAPIRPIKQRLQAIFEALHVRGVSHGDLHANNIMVSCDDQGRITGMWVIDFGRATGFHPYFTESSSRGTRKPTHTHATQSMFTRKMHNVPVFSAGNRHNSEMAVKHFGVHLNENRIKGLRQSVLRNLQSASLVARAPHQTASLVGTARAPRSQSASPARGSSRRGRAAQPRTSF